MLLLTHIGIFVAVGRGRALEGGKLSPVGDNGYIHYTKSLFQERKAKGYTAVEQQ